MKVKILKKTKINVKRIFLTIGVIFLIALFLIIFMGNNNTYSNTEVSYKKIYVSSGDTLWEIAETEAANNAYYAKSDVRYIMKDLKEINKLTTSNIYVGQELIIPCY